MCLALGDLDFKWDRFWDKSSRANNISTYWKKRHRDNCESDLIVMLYVAIALSKGHTEKRTGEKLERENKESELRDPRTIRTVPKCISLRAHLPRGAPLARTNTPQTHLNGGGDLRAQGIKAAPQFWGGDIYCRLTQWLWCWAQWMTEKVYRDTVEVDVAEEEGGGGVN